MRKPLILAPNITAVFCLMALAAVLLAFTPVQRVAAQVSSLEETVAAVVRIKTFINPEGRTAETLGRERQGSGVVIASDGLVLTIGYLIVEALAAEVTTSEGRTHAAEVVGYDFVTGIGLLRVSAPLKIKPLPLGASARLVQGDKVLVVGGGADAIGPAHVASKREFAGTWEYLLDEAIFTSPPYPWWGGAALVNREGRLVGIGSLSVGDASGLGDRKPGNMFVPIDLLPPVLAELIADGRVSGPAKPWLGLNCDEVGGALLVRRLTPGGPAEKAGVKPGDVIIGVGGAAPGGLAGFYRRIWALGTAGVMVPLDIRRGGSAQRLELKSQSRRDHLKLGSTF